MTIILNTCSLATLVEHCYYAERLSCKIT